MSVPYLREAAAQDDLGKLVRFVRLHLGDGNEAVGKEEIDRSWAEAIKILLRDEPVDREFIAWVLETNESTLALLFFHLHFYIIRRSGRWIHDGSRSPRGWDAAPAGPLAHHQRALPRFDDSQRELRASGALGKAALRIPLDAGQLLRRASENRPASGCLPSLRRLPFCARAFKGEAR